MIFSPKIRELVTPVVVVVVVVVVVAAAAAAEVAAAAAVVIDLFQTSNCFQSMKIQKWTICAKYNL